MVENLRGIYTLWLRDVKRFLRDRARIIGSASPPLLWLFIIGTGLNRGVGSAISAQDGGLLFGADDYMSFLYPGVIGMTLLFTSMFSAVSIIWDREFGFLKEVLVAPISRWAVAVGRTLGGATVAVFQGAIMLIFAPVVGVDLSVLTMLNMIVFMFIIAFSLTSLGMAVAARMRSMEGFQMIMNFVTLPMFFLSGAIFPLNNLPSWLDVLVRIDPLTYGVDLLRGVLTGVTKYSLLTDLG
ncbi:MAG: ABC transporter permease, partial [Terriglobia bacterium]